jgi:hypothetical protein
MNWIAKNFKWVMLVSGVLTFTMVYAALFPQAALESNFGETLDGPLAEIVVRNWGALIALMGVMLIYGAFNAASRQLVLAVAGLSKVVFIALVLMQGAKYLGQPVRIALIIDSLMVLLFVFYLIAVRSVSRAA